MALFGALLATEGVSHATQPDKPVEGLSPETLALAKMAGAGASVVAVESNYLTTPGDGVGKSRGQEL